MHMKPPYYMVSFVSRLSDEAGDDYHRTATRMVELAQSMPGFLGMDSTRGTDGLGITLSYWASEEAILNWKNQAEHILARKMGRDIFYDFFDVKIARVERAYDFRKG